MRVVSPSGVTGTAQAVRSSSDGVPGNNDAIWPLVPSPSRTTSNSGVVRGRTSRGTPAASARTRCAAASGLKPTVGTGWMWPSGTGASGPAWPRAPCGSCCWDHRAGRSARRPRTSAPGPTAPVRRTRRSPAACRARFGVEPPESATASLPDPRRGRRPSTRPRPAPTRPDRSLHGRSRAGSACRPPRPSRRCRCRRPPLPRRSALTSSLALPIATENPATANIGTSFSMSPSTATSSNPTPCAAASMRTALPLLASCCVTSR